MREKVTELKTFFAFLITFQSKLTSLLFTRRSLATVHVYRTPKIGRFTTSSASSLLSFQLPSVNLHRNTRMYVIWRERERETCGIEEDSITSLRKLLFASKSGANLLANLPVVV